MSDFLSSLIIGIVPPPEHPRPPTNVLIILHGLGDSETPFTNLGRQLNLPSTCVIAVRAPNPLPLGLDGFHWGDDINISQGSGNLDTDAGFNTAARVLREEVVTTVLVEKCGFLPRNVLAWGFGQGGMAALALAASLEGQRMADGSQENRNELGGIVSIGGALPESIAARNGQGEFKFRTPVILLGGSSATTVTNEQVERIKRTFEFVERIMWRRSGDGMPRSREEMLPIMQFLARRLRAAAPNGAVEIG